MMAVLAEMAVDLAEMAVGMVVAEEMVVMVVEEVMAVEQVLFPLGCRGFCYALCRIGRARRGSPHSTGLRSMFVVPCLARARASCSHERTHESQGMVECHSCGMFMKKFDENHHKECGV